MKRIKSIDIIRGTSILYMLIGHFLEWWIIPEDYWAYILLRILFEPIGSSAFIFIAGVSTSISYRNRMKKIDQNNNWDLKKVKHEYLIRASLILLIGITYNFFVSLATGNIIDTWKYFVLVTIGLSLLISWPLLNTSKWFRCIIGIIVWAINYFLFEFLRIFQGQMNVYGILFHLLYNSLDVDPLIYFFTFFIIGTVIGDLLDEFMLEEDLNKRKTLIKTKLLKPFLFFSLILILFGILFQFPAFLQHRTFSWYFYALGCILILISSLLTLELYQIIYKKGRKGLLFYFSYYSLTLYLAHNLLFFLFVGQLSFIYYVIASIITVLIIGIVLKYAYEKLGKKISLKFLISITSSELAKFTVKISIKEIINAKINGKALKS